MKPNTRTINVDLNAEILKLAAKSHVSKDDLMKEVTEPSGVCHW